MKLASDERWPLAAAVLIALGAYARTAGFHFVYDDTHVIQNRELLHSLANWREIVRSTWWEYALYRPLTQLSFAADWTLSGGQPGWFHIVNALIHGAVTALVYLVARGGLGPLGAGSAALLFAVHPVHVEAVAGVVGRAELLATWFALLAVLAYRADGRLAARADRSWRRWCASLGTLAAVLLALASKESAFATPGLLLLSDWWEGHRVGEPARESFRRHWLLWAAAVALALEWLWIRGTVLGDLAGDHPAAGLDGEDLLGRTLVMAPIILQYVRLLLFPVHLSADYSVDYVHVASRVTALGLVGLLVAAGATAVAVRARHRAPPLAFGLAWIAGTVFIVANVIVPTGVLVAERTLYLPSVGAVILLGWLAAWAEASWRRVGVALVAFGVGLGLVRSELRLPAWSDNSRFYPQLVRDAPGSYRSYWVAGGLAYDSGDRARGEALVRRAISIYPLHPQMWATLATQLDKDGRFAEAGPAYAAIFRLDSTRFDDGLRGVRAYVKAGLPDSARALAERLGKVDRNDFRYQTARAEIAAAAGRPLEAMTWHRRAAWQFPRAWQFWYLVALDAIQARWCPEARLSVARIRSLDPTASHLAELEDALRRSGCVP